MEFIQDLLAAIGVVLNGIPQGLLAISFGFASVPTALGFVVGAVACGALGSVVPISFQAETITLAGTMGKDLRERLSMVFYAGAAMLVLGACGLLGVITDFAGDVIVNAMMAGVGIMLAKVSFGMIKENMLVGSVSLATAVAVYFFFGQNLVYTIVISLIVSSIAAKAAGQDVGGGMTEKMGKLTFQKPAFNLRILRGALALCCLTVGGNIAFGSITGGIAGANANIDHLTIYSGLADAVSSLFGGGPVEAIISATAGAPHPVTAGVLMMVIMAAILFVGLLPKIGKFVPNQSIAGFLFILGAVVTVPTNAAVAFSGTAPGDNIVGGVTIVVTAAVDPFVGMLAGLALKLLFSMGIGV
ncbi:MAG: NCS2 family permease [Lachnospiraceae bacterium]|jgi:AGZA family xanthine/uracil permease-like MFS transporter|nr:NCS2 family permease [Lachnospiraceae bacterium]MCI9682541.1 NCS2 family permease [Lachnospiraceae bacterium]